MRKGKDLNQQLKYLRNLNFYLGFSEVEFIDGFKFPRPMPFLEHGPFTFDLNKTGDYPNHNLNTTTTGPTPNQSFNPDWKGDPNDELRWKGW